MEPKTWDAQTELAKERNRIAADRTLLTWIRTSVSFIGLGFGSKQILDVLTVEIRDQQHLRHAAIDHRQQIRNLERNELHYVSRLSPTLVVAYILAILGVIAFVTLAVSQNLPGAFAETVLR